MCVAPFVRVEGGERVGVHVLLDSVAPGAWGAQHGSTDAARRVGHDEWVNHGEAV